jgi:1,4-dihydroxy-2-naphthoate octaprenyltransferase
LPDLRSWLEEVRPQFLLASGVSVLVGVSLAVYEGFPFRLFNLILATSGAWIAHIGIHAFNDYSDYVTGIDLKVHRTPYSGGSGVLPSGKLQPSHVYYFGVSCLLIVVMIGIYFIATLGFAIIPLGLLGIGFMYFYTSHLARVGLGELATATGFALWSIGTYFVQVGYYSLDILAVSLLPALAGVSLLLLNEFPDVEADRLGGRRNIPLMLGLEPASRIYSLQIGSMYVWLLVLIVVRILPVPALLGIMTLPIAIRAVSLAWKGCGDHDALMKALKMNVIVVLALPFLVSVGTLLGSI